MDAGSFRYHVYAQVSRLLESDQRGLCVMTTDEGTAGSVTNRFDSWFFRKGQVIETFRGKGIYQRAIDEATEKLDQGRWVRQMFSQGGALCESC